MNAHVGEVQVVADAGELAMVLSYQVAFEDAIFSDALASLGGFDVCLCEIGMEERNLQRSAEVLIHRELGVSLNAEAGSGSTFLRSAVVSGYRGGIFLSLLILMINCLILLSFLILFPSLSEMYWAQAHPKEECSSSFRGRFRRI